MTPSSERRASEKRGSTVHGAWPNAVIENFYERPPTDRNVLGAWCYTDRLSYVAGDIELPAQRSHLLPIE